MMHSGVFADGPKGLVGLHEWQRRDGTKRSVSYSIVRKHIEESEALGN